MTAAGLSRLSIWWLSLGIEVEYTRPGHPEDNGRHERMHRTLKAECCQPPSANLPAQQRRFARFRERFNHERPHEAIGLRVPADLYQPSLRRYQPAATIDLYEPNTETLLVSDSGLVTWLGQNWFIGEAFAGQHLALDPNHEPTPNPDTRLVRFANVPLGIIGDVAYGRLRPPASTVPKPRRTCRPQPNKL